MPFIGKKEIGNEAQYFRKRIMIREGVRSVRIGLTAIGAYKGYVNGREIDCDLLSPGWVNFFQRIPFYTYDVTDRVRLGQNEIEIVAGNGWAVGKIAWFGKRLYGDRPLVWCRIETDYGETREVVESDESWTVSCGRIAENDVFDGETHDAGRLCAEQPCEAVEGIRARLEPAMQPPIRLKETLPGRSLGEKDGWEIFDFGQNHAGVIRLRLGNSRPGAKLTVVYGEALRADGSVYTDNLRTAKCTDRYVCSGQDEAFEPLFTYHGYRYCGIRTEGGVSVSEVISRAVYTDIPYTGQFVCSSDNVNRLFRNIVWGQKSNFVGIPTDCPQRDERLGWTGDCQVFCRTAMYNADCREFFRNYLREVRDAQAPSGMIDPVAPSVAGDFDGTTGAPGWGDVIAVLPYEYWLMYREKDVLRENLSAAKRWVDYCVRTSEDGIRPACGYGDWLSVGEETDKSVLATLFMAGSAGLVSRMCRIVGDPEAEKYAELWRNIRTRFRERLIGADGVIASDTQTCYLLAYRFGVIGGEETKPHLLRTLARSGNRLATGFLGVRHLLPVLSELGCGSLAYELLTRTDYPSWCYSVENGATTVWERWNSYTLREGFADNGMNSFNHYSLGSVGEWLYSDVLGIRQTETGTVVRPLADFSGRLTWAEGGCTVGGRRISVRWRVTDGCADIEVSGADAGEVDLSGYEILERDGNKWKVKAL